MVGSKGLGKDGGQDAGALAPRDAATQRARDALRTRLEIARDQLDDARAPGAPKTARRAAAATARKAVADALTALDDLETLERALAAAAAANRPHLSRRAAGDPLGAEPSWRAVESYVHDLYGALVDLGELHAHAFKDLAAQVRHDGTQGTSDDVPGILRERLDWALGAARGIDMEVEQAAKRRMP
jgi:hypothetical protein